MTLTSTQFPQYNVMQIYKPFWKSYPKEQTSNPASFNMGYNAGSDGEAGQEAGQEVPGGKTEWNQKKLQTGLQNTGTLYWGLHTVRLEDFDGDEVWDAAAYSIFKHRMEFTDTGQATWEETEKKLKKGWIEVDPCEGKNSSWTMRLALQQWDIVRIIDDFSIEGVNSAAGLQERWKY